MLHLRPGFFPLPSRPDYAPETKRKGTADNCLAGVMLRSLWPGYNGLLQPFFHITGQIT
jgi:hypothetical protein